MMWIGLLLGAAIGAAIGGPQGAIAAGFLGWLAGVIVQSQRRGREEGASPSSAPRRETFEERMQRLERTVAELQARIERLETGGAPVEAAATPAPTTPEAPATQTEPTAPLARAEPQPEGSRPEPRPIAQPEPAAPPPPAEPPRPNPIVAWLTGGNAIARVGLLILFFGLAFLLKYAADRQLFPPELRVGAVAAGGIALLVLGWRLRERRRGYALGLQGAGVAVLYLTTFGALRLYGLIPAEAAFALLAAIAALSAFIAVRQDSQVLAGFAAGGGFLAPILASTGTGSHVALFGYYLLLNAAIAGIALFKAWRALNLLGFAFTFFIGLAWGLRFYRPEYFDTTEPFLAAFFLLYVLIAVLYARRQPTELRHPVDGTLVFGTPLAAFALQAALMRGSEFGLAFSALAAAWLYVALAWGLKRSGRGYWALLSEAFLALGVVFATAAIPLALDARWTSAAWALEGAAVVWVGIRQRRTVARYFGLLLQVLAGGAYLNAYGRFPAEVPLVDAAFVGAVLMAIAGLWTHRKLGAARGDVTAFERGLVPFAFAWGVLWWLFAAHHEIDAFLAYRDGINAHVAVAGATALVLGALALRWTWREAAVAARLLLPVLVLMALWSFIELRHPFARFGWLAWPFALAVEGWILARLAPEGAHWRHAAHAGSQLLLAALGARELHWVAANVTAHGTAWSVAAIAVAPAVLMLLAASRFADARWPVAAEVRAYRVTGAGVLAVALAVWSLAANVLRDGRSDPLPYLPLLNALDLAHILAGLAIAAAWMAMRRTGLEPPRVLAGRGAAVAAGAIAFIWLNGVLLRTLHHWAGVPYDLHAIGRSVLAQASLSVFWSVLALALMVFATRTARRALWMLGAGLMAVVVAKLFLVDLSHVGGIERIVSFIAVGVLMLVIGYVSPAPPRQVAAKPAGPLVDDDEVRPEAAP